MTTRARAFYLLKKSDKNDLKRLGHPTFIRLFKIRFHSSSVDIRFEIYSLQGLLKEEYWGNKVLLLPDVTFQDCTGFLELVYTGKVN